MAQSFYGSSGVLDPFNIGSGLGDQLRDQVGQETEEERRRRLLALQKQSQTQPISSIFATGAYGNSSSPLGTGSLGTGSLGGFFGKGR